MLVDLEEKRVKDSTRAASEVKAQDMDTQAHETLRRSIEEFKNPRSNQMASNGGCPKEEHSA